MKLKATNWLPMCACALTLALSPTSAKPIFQRDSKSAITEIDSSTQLGQRIKELIDSRSPVAQLGLVAANLSDFKDETAVLARNQLKMSKRLQILYVVPGMIADRLGIVAGDEILEINGHYLANGESALAQLETSIVPQIDWNGEISATIIRDGYGQTLSIPANAKYVKAKVDTTSDS